MKVQELRNLVTPAECGNLEKAFVECYKQLRKPQKEEIDAVLCALLEGKEAKAKKADAPVNFEELSQQIYDFMFNAYAGNYFAPNRLIPKSQRPKWRFMVKDFIKELTKIPADSENYEKSVKLLTDLYKLICAACNISVFHRGSLPFDWPGTGGPFCPGGGKDLRRRIFAGENCSVAAFCGIRRAER